MNNLFYCPKCKKQDDAFNADDYIPQFGLGKLRDDITFLNSRNGYGRHVTHILCPECGYELSGFINYKGLFDENSCFSHNEHMEYLIDIIKGYSDGSYIETEKLLKLIRKNIDKKKELKTKHE